MGMQEAYLDNNKQSKMQRQVEENQKTLREKEGLRLLRQ